MQSKSDLEPRKYPCRTEVTVLIYWHYLSHLIKAKLFYNQTQR